MFDIKKLKSIQVSLASPETIRSWSKGEIKSGETINYRTQKPVLDGILCERIFGPSRDNECNCGKYKKAKEYGRICDKCGVEVTSKKVRRERMGHVELISPCVHIWYLKSSPSVIGTLLNYYCETTVKDLEAVVYYKSFICTDAGKQNVIVKGQTIDSSATSRELILNVLNEIKEKNKGNANICRDADESINFINEEQIVSDRIYEFISDVTGLKLGQGGEAIKKLLTDVGNEIETIYKKLLVEINKAKSSANRSKLIKRLEVVKPFLLKRMNPVTGKMEYINKPEWMVLDNIPVIPAGLRPLLDIGSGRQASSDLNELYRKLIIRNNRLKEHIQQNSTTLMGRNERRLIQECVDKLIDYDRLVSSKPKSQKKDILKCLTSKLKGKSGIFRKNLLGKRVDYSGRSVIAVGPDLKMYQCGLPREMAIELFEPYIIHELRKDDPTMNLNAAKREVLAKSPRVHGIIERIISDHPVLLNRAPTLHRLSIQAFQPKLVDGHAIRLHPLVCTGFNADFDGDTMSVHVPLRKEAQEEAIHLMLASNNILSPKDGKPIVTPSQDMVLGNYYLTLELTKEDFLEKAKIAHNNKDYDLEEEMKLYAACEGKVFASREDVIKCYETKQISLHNRIAVLGKGLHKDLSVFNEKMQNQYIITSVGRVIFNSIFPKNFPYINTLCIDSKTGKDNFELLKTNLLRPNEKNLEREKEIAKQFVDKGTDIKEYISKLPVKTPIKKKVLEKIIDQLFHRYNTLNTSIILDKIKDTGFKYSTVSGITMSLMDMKVVKGKEEEIKKADENLKKINNQIEAGLMFESDKHKKIIENWSICKESVKKRFKEEFPKDKFNPLFYIFDSGARGDADSFVQLLGMRGTMNKPNGDKIELPIKSCFREGMNVGEFFIATHGARKGSSDTALKTSDSGYLTRRLVDVASSVIVREEDCGTDQGFVMRAIVDKPQNGKGEEKVLVSLYDRIRGRYAMHNVVDPNTGKVLVKGNELITNTIAHLIADDPKDGGAGIKEVEIRSVLTCRCKDGVCRHCYGRNLATKDVIEIGAAVGVMAGQSIGEPGTQLTMRTFHSGGIGETDITIGLPRVAELVEARNPKKAAVIARINGTVSKIEENKYNDSYLIYITNEFEEEPMLHKTGANLAQKDLLVKEGDIVKAGDPLTRGSIWPKDLLAVTDVTTVSNYFLTEIRKPYSANGQNINDKHLEIILKQMLREVYIYDAGETDLLSGVTVNINVYTEANKKALLEGKRPAIGKQVIVGITRAAEDSPSFLSSASFQQTPKALTAATINCEVDNLVGLKENVITGKIIPAGRGLLTEEQEKALVENFSSEAEFQKIADKYNEELDSDNND